MRFFIILITLIVGGVYFFAEFKADDIAKNIIESEATKAAEREVKIDNLKIALIKDKSSDNVQHTYSAILPSSTIQSLSDVDGGDRIKVISTSHNLSGFDFKRFYTSSSFSMSLSCKETTLFSSPATQGFSPPYRAILYDIITQKPLVLFSENLGIEGQDNVFIKADGTSVSNNILNLQP